MSKKLHAKEMKADPVAVALAGAYSKGRTFVRHNGRTLAIGAAVLVGAIVIYTVVAAAIESKRSVGGTALAAALTDLRKTEGGAEDAPSWTDLQARFEQVARDHGGMTGRLARHFGAVAQLRAGDARGAATVLDELAGGPTDDWLTPASLLALASAQEIAGDADGARASLERLRQADFKGCPRDAATYLLAGLEERLGQLDSARVLYEELADTTDEDEPSPLAGQARSRLDQLAG